jgi:hypothetical protein
MYIIDIILFVWLSTKIGNLGLSSARGCDEMNRVLRTIATEPVGKRSSEADSDGPVVDDCHSYRMRIYHVDWDYVH